MLCSARYNNMSVPILIWSCGLHIEDKEELGPLTLTPSPKQYAVVPSVSAK